MLLCGSGGNGGQEDSEKDGGDLRNVTDVVLAKVSVWLNGWEFSSIVLVHVLSAPYGFGYVGNHLLERELVAIKVVLSSRGGRAK